MAVVGELRGIGEARRVDADEVVPVAAGQHCAPGNAARARAVEVGAAVVGVGDDDLAPAVAWRDRALTAVVVRLHVEPRVALDHAIRNGPGGVPGRGDDERAGGADVARPPQPPRGRREVALVVQLDQHVGVGVQLDEQPVDPATLVIDEPLARAAIGARVRILRERGGVVSPLHALHVEARVPDRLCAVAPARQVAVPVPQREPHGDPRDRGVVEIVAEVVPVGLVPGLHVALAVHRRPRPPECVLVGAAPAVPARCVSALVVDLPRELRHHRRWIAALVAESDDDERLAVRVLRVAMVGRVDADVIGAGEQRGRAAALRLRLRFDRAARTARGERYERDERHVRHAAPSLPWIHGASMRSDRYSGTRSDAWGAHAHGEVARISGKCAARDVSGASRRSPCRSR
jgi:hypothetical protein